MISLIKISIFLLDTFADFNLFHVCMDLVLFLRRNSSKGRQALMKIITKDQL